MLNWNIPLADLQGVTLAADVRFGNVDYTNDHIWEWKINDSLPACLALSTSFGLRARRYLMFPVISEKKVTVCDPAEFPQAPVVQWALPQFCQLTFSPLPAIEVEAEVWIPDSQTICGRFRLINHAQSARLIRLSWASLLTPLEQTLPLQTVLSVAPGSETSHRMAAAQIQHGWSLAGKTANLMPVICMSGGAEIENNPFPALGLSIEIPPGSWRDWNWAQAALGTAEDSYRQARSYLLRNWDAERTRILMGNTGLLEVETGIPAWDRAFALSQQIGLSLFNSSPADAPEDTRLPYPSLLQTRHSDQGYSLSGDGRDYPLSWSGQSVLDVRYLADLLLLSAPELVKGLLLNFLAVQDPASGFIDGKPGLSGKRGRLAACPILADTVWKIYQSAKDDAFLEACYPALLKYLAYWLTEKDFDGDGVPEWDHPAQFGFPDHPVYSPQAEASQGANIAAVESPALAAFLYRECLALRKISDTLGLAPPALVFPTRPADAQGLSGITARLQETVRAAWVDEQAGFTYRDRDAHNAPPSQTILRQTGCAVVPLQQTFPQPLRFVLQVETGQEKTQRPLVTLRGRDGAGKPVEEIIPVYRWQWLLRKIGRVTSQNVFSRVDEIRIENIQPTDVLTINSLDFWSADLSLSLPLWAEMLDAGRARSLVEDTLTRPEKYWSEHGLRLTTESNPPVGENPEDDGISFVWNTLIGQGMLAYGYRSAAHELLNRLMENVTGTLAEEKCLRATYHPVTGKGLGERNALSGLAPLGFFLDVLGVKIYSPWKVGLEDVSPFPQTVHITYRGLDILRSPQLTRIIFPDEQVVEITDPEACIISLEE